MGLLLMMKRGNLQNLILLFTIVLTLCILLLWLVGFLPKQAIHKNIQQSRTQLEHEGLYPRLLDQNNPSYQLDNFSEALIMSHSYFLDTRSDWKSMIMNPTYSDGKNPVSSLIEISDNKEMQSNSTRSHYWMGFRIYIRILLSFFNLSQIRNLIFWIYSLLFITSIFIFKKHIGTTIAFLYAISILFANPTVVAASAQFSCTYIIMFLGILLVSFFYMKKFSYNFLFLLLGQLTQFFDFYTTPIITWGMPLILVLFLEKRQAQKKSNQPFFSYYIKITLKSLSIWLCAYLSMWVIKLFLVTLFSQSNGFSIFQSVLYYIGAAQRKNVTYYYSIKEAISKPLRSFFSGPQQYFFTIIILFFISSIFYTLIKSFKNKGFIAPEKKTLFGVLFFITIIPIIWFAIAKQATATHFWFQSRSLSLSVFSILNMIFLLMPQKNKLKNDS